jgi:hypothetical protein
MDDRIFVVGIAAVILAVFAVQAISHRFDPFAPVWLFLVGFAQVYVVQATSYREWALRVRGGELVTAANARALWALLWFLVVYLSGLGRMLASKLPRPPSAWSTTAVGLMSPVLTVWGLICAGMLFTSGDTTWDSMSGEESLLRAFPFVMLVAACLLVVTGRHANQSRGAFLGAGLAVAVVYIVIWMFNGKRSHSLIGVLATVCAFYVSKRQRPTWPVLAATAFSGVLVVALAIGWRMNKEHPKSFAGFTQFLGNFQLSSILASLNMDTFEEASAPSYETEEYGGFLLMMDTVPEKADHDYGASYLRVFSTFIPRLVWSNKPVFGREQWVNAWIAGSEIKRDEKFSGPAIGILGAAQLNGGAWGTLILLAAMATLLRTAYEYFLIYSNVAWTQAWWSLVYYNAWFMVVCDDPLIWFYYNWGYTTLPPLILLWIIGKFSAQEVNGPWQVLAVPAHHGF